MNKCIFFVFTLIHVYGKLQCKKILDPDAPLRDISKFLPPEMGFDYNATFRIFPLTSDLSKCLANYQGLKFTEIARLGMEIKSCVATQKLSKTKEMKDLLQNLPTISSPLKIVSGIETFLDFLLKAKRRAHKNVCQSFIDHVLPCSNEIVPKLLASLENHSNGCCDEFFHNVQAQTGTTAAQMVQALGSHLSKAICSIQKPGFNQAPEQTCGYTLLHVYGSTVPFDIITKFFQSFQLSKEQACDAFEGKPFIISGSNEQFSIGNRETGRVLSACSAPLDELAMYFASMPVILHTPILSKLFQESVDADEAAEALPVPSLVKKVLKVLTALFNGNRRIQIANGYSSQCSFSTSVSALSKTPPRRERGGPGKNVGSHQSYNNLLMMFSAGLLYFYNM